MNKVKKEERFEFLKKNHDCCGVFKIALKQLNPVELNQAYFDFLISILVNSYEECLEKSNIKQYVFIPETSEIVHEAEGYIDVFYPVEDVEFPNEVVKKHEIEGHLTEDGDCDEVGKCIFHAAYENGQLCVEFTSLEVLTEDGSIESIWSFKDGIVRKLFVEMITDLFYEEE